jgi:hypothetical protein
VITDRQFSNTNDLLATYDIALDTSSDGNDREMVAAGVHECCHPFGVQGASLDEQCLWTS